MCCGMHRDETERVAAALERGWRALVPEKPNVAAAPFVVGSVVEDAER